MSICGVYVLYNLISEKYYIGSSVDIERRINCHKSDLKRHTHPSVFMQKDFDEYGWENFDYKILEEVPLDKLKEREIYYLKTYFSETDSYNGTTNYRGVCKTSNETKQKQRIKKLGANNPNFGKQFSEERKRKISNSLKGRVKVYTYEGLMKRSKVNEQQILEISSRLNGGEYLKDLASEYNVSIATISNIKHKKHPYFRFTRNN